MHSFRRFFVDATHELEQETLLDDVVSIYGRSDTVHQTRIDMIGFDHSLQLSEFRVRERVGESVSIVHPFFDFASDIDNALCWFSSS